MNLDRLILTTDQIAEIRRIARNNAASPFEQMLKGKLMYDPMFVMEFERSVGLQRCSSFDDEEKPLSRDDVVRRLVRLTHASVKAHFQEKLRLQRKRPAVQLP